MKERKVVKGAFRRQDDDGDDEKQVGRGKVVRSQCEEDKQQGGEGRGWSNEVRKSDGDETRGDKDERRGEMGKGVDKGGERVNLEDWLQRFTQRQREQQQGGRDESWEQRQGCRDESWEQQQGNRNESWEKDGGYCEQRQEIDWDERERLRGGIGQGKGMRKGQGKGKRRD